ncbi:MAG: hypothetical protein LLG14_12635 [Nocardiaceae bacterium]|nr:hypothetical protein [Nocardiaceae bacterium]
MAKNLVQRAGGLAKNRSEDDPERQEVMNLLAYERVSGAIDLDVALLTVEQRERLATVLLVGPAGAG